LKGFEPGRNGSFLWSPGIGGATPNPALLAQQHQCIALRKNLEGMEPGEDIASSPKEIVKSITCTKQIK
jgi:hypothetical protein